MSDIKVGDTVRVTFEDVVVEVDEDGTLWFNLEFDDGVNDTIVGYRPGDETTKSIEKVEPPVVTFKPGDFVRHKTYGSTYLVTTSGVTALTDGRHYAKDAEWREKCLTSKHYDKVELHEAPL